eukprot:Nk52_evm5s39 gene=Nk52_evmTU5s39
MSSGISSASTESGGHCGTIQEEYVGHPLMSQYTLISSLERGHLGLLRDRMTGDICFLKIFSKGNGDLASEQMLAIRDECLYLKCLSHPSICKLIDVVETDHTIYMVLEHYPHSMLNLQGQAMLLPQCMTVFSSLVSAVAHLHSNGICHTNLCPQKILITDDFNVKICGLSRLVKSQWCLNETNEEEYSDIRYVAPEAREIGATFDGFRANIFTLGCLLRFLCQECRLSMDKTSDNCNEGLQEKLSTLIVSMCELEPEDRPSIETVERNFLLALQPEVWDTETTNS